jgi:acyl carrier protein
LTSILQPDNICQKTAWAKEILMDKNGPGGTEIKKALRAFISSSTLPLARVGSFTDEDSFLEKGILDSTGVLELVGHIENEYQIRFEADEIIPDNLDSIDKIADFVARKTAR